MKKLNESVTIITGASSGIGAATALQLAKAGSTLGEIVGNRNIFRCTTESNVATDAWILIWHFEMLDGVFWERVAVKTYSKLSDSGYNVRPFFAF